jgi:MFS family permease
LNHPGNTPFAPFAVRSFRFQWPSDLLTSLAFEMETLILGWYVLVETRSVILLAVFGSLQYLGALVAPVFGVMGDRLGRRTLLCSMRAFYAGLALLLMALGLSGSLTPAIVFALTVPSGLVRPSDLVMRNALIGDTMPQDRLMNAMGLSRTTMDMAKIAGALVGSGLFALLGLGYSYIFVAAFYLASFCLTLGVSGARASGKHPGEAAAPQSTGWRDLKEGLAYVWNTPDVLAIMGLAFLANLTAFPLTSGLLPYVAREVYHIDAIGLGHLVAAFAIGALAGSIALTLAGARTNAPRFLVVSLLLWYAALGVFLLYETKAAGLVLLLFIGFFQSLTMITMAVGLLSAAGDRFRSRVMGVRMLAVYGLPLGLLASGVMIASFGFNGTIALYCAAGALATIAIALRWRASMRR